MSYEFMCHCDRSDPCPCNNDGPPHCQNCCRDLPPDHKAMRIWQWNEYARQEIEQGTYWNVPEDFGS